MDTSIFELIDGLTPVDPAALAEFKRAIIPEIVRVIEERQAIAAKTRHLPLRI
jgi:hypothetical protein